MSDDAKGPSKSSAAPVDLKEASAADAEAGVVGASSGTLTALDRIRDTSDPEIGALYLLHEMVVTCPFTRPSQDQFIAECLRSGVSSGTVAAVVEQLSQSGDVYRARDLLLARAVRNGTITSKATQALLAESQNVHTSGKGGCNRPVAGATGDGHINMRVVLPAPKADVIAGLIQTLMLVSSLLLGFNHANYRMLHPTALADADARWEGYCANETHRDVLDQYHWCDEPPSTTLFFRSMWSFAGQ